MKSAWMEKAKAAALALTVAAPMCYVLQISMGIVMPFWYTLLFAVLSIALLEFININKWTAIGIPAVIVLTCGYLWAVFDKDQRQFLIDYYWWVVDFLYNGGAYPAGNAMVLTAGVSFLTTLVVWLFGRRFFCFPAVFAFVVAFVLFKWLQGLDIVLEPGVAACGGLILLWAKSFQRKTAKKSGKKLPENGIALYLLPVAALITLLGLVMVPRATAESWQSKQVYDLFERVNNYIADYTGFNRPRHSFTIAAYGFMPMGSRLGGPTELSDSEVMYVTTSRRMLLRGIVYNDYDGKLWRSTTQSPAIRFGDSKETLGNAFDSVRPVLSEPYATDFKRFIEPLTVVVQPAIDSSSTVFTPYRGVTEVTSDKFLAVVPKFNAKGEIFSASDIHTGYNYKVKADYLIYDAGGFNELMNGLMGLGLSDSPEQSMYIRNNYLGLPENIEQGVYDTVNDIRSGKTLSLVSVIKRDGSSTQELVTTWSAPEINNQYQMAMAIKDYLSYNFHYTLSPVVPPEDTDFVSYFLNHDRNGYCTYFASAMAVMARIAGIPSRYVEGYMMPGKEESESYYTVRGKNAHAWAELYFDGIGWIPFDATPAGESNAGEVGGDSGGYIPFPTPTMPDDNIGGDIGTIDVGDRLTWEDIAQYMWLLPVALAAGLLGWVIAMMIRARTRVSSRRLERKYPDASRRCAFLYFECAKMLVYYNYPVKTGETLYAYAVRIDRWLRLRAGTFAGVAELMSKLSYSDYKPTEKDLRFMAAFRADLAKYTYNAVGPWFYLIHHVMGFKVKQSRRRER